MRPLFPEIEPYRLGRLRVSSLHDLYYEECGNPHGQPVVFLHGGPGGGIGVDSRRYFDPSFYRIILFDQRGAGKSTPYADIRENTSWNLIDDMERLRFHLGVHRWLVFGGSWGSTLALLYAIHHPDQVVGLVLRGVYLGSYAENQWLFQHGASLFFPEKWQSYLNLIPSAEQGNLIEAYYRRLTDPNEAVHLAAAQAWGGWESALTHLIPVQPTNSTADDPASNLAIARIECHYMNNRMFFPRDDYILSQSSAIAHIPCRIVHGRYDLICPIASAWNLFQVLPHADLRIIPDAGHAGREPGIASELVQATDDFKSLF